MRVRLGHAAREVLRRRDRGHLRGDGGHRAQRPARHQPGDARDDTEEQGEADQHGRQRRGDGALFVGQGAAGMDGEVAPVPRAHLDGGEAVVAALAVDGGGAVGVLGLVVDLAGLPRLRLLPVAVAVTLGRAARGAGLDRVGAGAADALQVLAGRDQPAVLVDHLDGGLVAVRQVEIRVRAVGRQLRGDLAGGGVRPAVGLAGEVGAQREQHGGAGRHQGEGDDQARAERGAGAHGTEEPPHRGASRR